jgi:signal transduction histidine kinase
MRVAAMATAVVMATYVVAVVALNIFVSHRLTTQADARLSQTLAGVTGGPGTFAVPAQSTGDQDLDDAPRFVWYVSSTGAPTPLVERAPRLPSRTWEDGATSVGMDGTVFRLDVVGHGDGWLVAGESLAQLQRVRSVLLLPEVLLGVALLIVVYLGSLVIGVRASAPLEEVHRRQVEFTADASHELRTPLSVIQAEVQVALTRPRTPHDYQAVLRRVDGESARLRHIVDDLLWLARMEDVDVVDSSDERTDVSAIAAETVERFIPLTAARDLSVRVEVAEDHRAWIAAPPGWIDRLIGVLVDNAGKFAGGGGTVEVGVRVVGPRVVLQVDDSGPGIPPDERQLVFDRFHRATDHQGGTGLGLAIADSVVRATHGTWLVDDSPLGGARMQVSWRRVAMGLDTRPTDTGPTDTGPTDTGPVPSSSSPRSR